MHAPFVKHPTRDGGPEAEYLYSFLDPHHPARGPMKSEHPTILATMQSSSTLVLTDGVTTATGWPEAPIGTAQMETGGKIAIVCGPTFFANKAASGTTLAPGYTCSTSKALDGLSYSNASYTPIAPIGTYAVEWPESISVGTVHATSGIYEPERDGMTQQAFRIVGLRATITCNSNVLATTGQVFAGDNGSYYPDLPAPMYQMSHLDSGGRIQEVATLEDQDLFEGSLENGVTTSRTMNCGAMTYGNTYEAVFVPTNDNILRYRTHFPTFVKPGSAAANDDQTMVGSPLLNGPYVLFYLSGVAPDTAITVSTVVSFELPIRLKSSLGILLAQARLSKNYVVDWSQLSSATTAGAPGTGVLTGISSSGKLTQGMAVAMGRLPQARTREQVSSGAGPRPSTSVVAEVPAKGSDDFATRLQKGSQIIRSSAELAGNIYGAKKMGDAIIADARASQGWMAKMFNWAKPAGRAIAGAAREAEMLAIEAGPIIEEVAEVAAIAALKKKKGRSMNKMGKARPRRRKK